MHVVYDPQNNNMSTHTFFLMRAFIDINGLTLTDFLGQECSLRGLLSLHLSRINAQE